MNFQGFELCCPRCHGDLSETGDRELELRCSECQSRYPVILDIPDLRVSPDPYIGIDEDHAKGRLIAERFGDLDFPALVEFYYSMTSVVPPQHARLYTRGLLAGGARSESALADWEAWSGTVGVVGRPSLLEVGCGTGPLLIAASKRYRPVGVDVAFRWLVVGKKRLTEAGVQVPLICACAEALPFRPQQFDRMAFESTLEVVRDQTASLAEARRLLRPDGWLFLATPNRSSLGPDPHTGIWATAYQPRAWVESRVRRMGAIPPQRHLLSSAELKRRLQSAGFTTSRSFLADVPAGQRATSHPG